MNDWVLAVLLFGLAGLCVWFSVRKALEDGFFNSLGTLAVLLAAYRFVDTEWRSITFWIRETVGIQGTHSISLSFWIGFLVILLPGLLIIKWLGNPPVPFPPEMEKNGSIALGAAIGLVVFASVVQSTYYFPFTSEHLAGPIQIFHPLFALLRSGHVGQ